MGNQKLPVQQAFALQTDKKSESLVSFLRKDNNIEVLNISNFDFKDRQKLLQLKYDFKANNQITKAGKWIIHCDGLG